MASINVDIDSLREYMRDYYGTATFNGFPVAIIDLADLDAIDGYELCEKAEQMGIDLRKFAIE